MSALAEHPSAPAPERLIGTWRRFGETGPLYEIVGIVDDQTMRIRVVESGEELDYRLNDILDDPRAV